MATTIADRLDRLDCSTSTRVLWRAQAQSFSFSLAADAVMEVLPVRPRVRTESYPDPAAHECRVTVRAGRPVACTCSADTAYEDACKHRVAVAIRPAVLHAARKLARLNRGWEPRYASIEESRADE
jgi:hypothetical protein